MDQLKVYFGSNRVVTVSGERPLQLHGTTTSTWIRFRKEFNIPECKSNEIRARLSFGILYITIPKKIALPQISHQEHDPLTPVQQPTPSSSRQDKGNLKQDSSSQSEEDDDEVFPDEQSSPAGAGDVMTEPIKNVAPLKAAPKYFISRLKMGRKTAVQVVAGVAVLFSYMLFCIIVCRYMMHV